MGIRDDLAAAPRKAATFDQWVKIAPKADVDAVLAACADHSLPATTLMNLCRQNDIPITQQTIKGYRS